ncbi:uncharacterized protein [Chelonus insularis]|uniref:uncharacterized protein n=1 Tax=Chelonus insularis TaxID=460826 RepID=UPI00158B82DD|nr:uncharacterized protein LOC118069912 [Chelonus insularis]
MSSTTKISSTLPVSSLTTMTDGSSITNWHIPRPSLVGRSEKDSEDGSNWRESIQQVNTTNLKSISDSTSSQDSTTSTHSVSSGSLLLTAANLANLAVIQPPLISSPKSMDTVSVASSTHFTVVNGLGRSTITYKKSWCARHQLTVLVCTMSLLFMIGLLAGVLYMEMRARDKYD